MVIKTSLQIKPHFYIFNTSCCKLGVGPDSYNVDAKFGLIMNSMYHGAVYWGQRLYERSSDRENLLIY